MTNWYISMLPCCACITVPVSYICHHYWLCFLLPSFAPCVIHLLVVGHYSIKSGKCDTGWDPGSLPRGMWNYPNVQLAACCKGK